MNSIIIRRSQFSRFTGFGFEGKLFERRCSTVRTLPARGGVRRRRAAAACLSGKSPNKQLRAIFGAYGSVVDIKYTSAYFQKAVTCFFEKQTEFCRQLIKDGD